MTPKEIRKRAGLPLIATAAAAKTTETTARVYELDREAVKDERKRAALDGVYADLASRLPRDSNPPPRMAG